MVFKLGINGFGRIGRVIFRASLQKADLEITAINDPAIDIEYICYLIKFDSTHGKFNGSVTHAQGEIYVNDYHIKVFHEKLPSDVAWQAAGVQYVIEASGMFTTLEKASGHLASESVRRVIVTAPSVDVPMVILGVNDDMVNAVHKVISCASSTLYCLAPIMKVLEDSYGVAEGFMTSIHAMTPSLKPLDGLCLRGKHWRDHRSIHQNIIPATTGACKALGKIIPRVKDKLSGLAFRVPIVNVSVLDLTIRLNTNTSIQEIYKNVEKASSTVMKNIIKISKDEAVSSDFIGETHSCILDADSSLQLKPNFFKLVCWYENEYSYACRVVDLIYYSEKQRSLASQSLKAKMQCMVQQMETCIKDPGTKSQQIRQFLLRKPVSFPTSATQSSNTKDAKKRSEMLKVLIDGKERASSSLMQDKKPLSHSYLTTPSQTQEEIECAKAQERLDQLKKEFSKMVNITENLLKKSYISHTSVTTQDKSIDHKEINKSVNILPDTNFEKIIQNCEASTEIFHETKESSRKFDISDDCRSTVKKTNKISSTKELFNTIELSLPQLPNYLPKNPESQKQIVTVENANIQYSSAMKFITPITQNSAYNATKKLLEKASKSKDSKNELNLLTNLGTKQMFQNNKHSEDKQKHVLNIVEHKKEALHWKSGTSDSGFFSVVTNNSAAESLQKNSADESVHLKETSFETIHKPDLDFDSTNDDNNIMKSDSQNIASEVHDYTDLNFEGSDMNITGDNKTIESDTQNNIKTSTFKDNTGSGGDISTNDDLCNEKGEGLPILLIEDGIAIHRKISSMGIEIVSLPEQILTKSDHASKKSCPDSPSMTVGNVNVNKHKQDIYDKLDSISGTDSNNSFQIHERKSQIIHLADLSNSLEDLARLDKICKIIEISDELSNKLFAELENNDSFDMKKKKWSFKDLCERMKLDEFCEKVFGK